MSNIAAAEVVPAAQHLENLGRGGDLRESQAAYRVLEESWNVFHAALDQ